MLNIKNNFLWKMMEISKIQNPIEKFDREFWKKSNEIAKSKKLEKLEPKILQANKGANI